MAQLSAPITYRTLLAFAVPMIVSQLFMNVNFIVDGVFMATPAADFLGASLTFLLLWRKRKQYGY